VECLFATTLANRLQAITNWRTWPSSERWSASDSAAKALCVALPSTVDAGTTERSTPPSVRPRLTTLGWPLAGATDPRENDNRLTSTGR
jgi:hypothetical protein